MLRSQPIEAAEEVQVLKSKENFSCRMLHKLSENISNDEDQSLTKSYKRLKRHVPKTTRNGDSETSKRGLYKVKNLRLKILKTDRR